MDEVGNDHHIDNGRLVVDAGDTARFFATHLASWDAQGPHDEQGAGAPLEIDRVKATELVHLLAGPIDGAQLEDIYDHVFNGPEAVDGVNGEGLTMKVSDLASYITSHADALGLGASDAVGLLERLDAQDAATDGAATDASTALPLPDDPPAAGTDALGAVTLPLEGVMPSPPDVWDSIAPLADGQPVHLLTVVDGGAVETATVVSTAADHVVARLGDSTEVHVSRNDIEDALKATRARSDSGRDLVLLAAGGALLVPAVVGAVALQRRHRAAR